VKNKGLHQYRFKDEPIEERFAKKWEEHNVNSASKQLDGKGTLDYLLAKNANYPNGEVTPRDREVAATVIQWLGSPVGTGFLTEVLSSC
jgi:hypothetical protein